MPADIQLPIAVFAGLFALCGIALAIIPARAAAFFESRGMQLRIGGPVPTTPFTVRIIGIVFSIFGLDFVALTVLFALGMIGQSPQ